jgi:transposase
MRQKSGRTKEPAERVVRDIRRATRRRFSAEEKIRIVLDGLRGEDSIAWKLCTTMKANDVTATLELALKASG